MVTSTYRAFISYSWADKAWAQWLLKALETYRTPKSLIGTDGLNGAVPPRLRPIFKDREEEAASANIGETVEQALLNSDYLIVVCSPNSAKSEWVNREIAFFKTHRDPSKILSLIVHGIPGASRGAGAQELECFPAALVHEVSPDGEITDEPLDLPLAADTRAEGDGKRNAKLKIAAAMLGVGLDDLVRRDSKRRSQIRYAITAATSAIALVTTGLAITAFIARDEAVAAKQLAEQRRDEAEGLIEFMVTDMRDELEAVGRLDVLDSTAQRALDYYAGQQAGELAPDALGRRARALLLFGEVHMARGQMDKALAAYQQAASTTREQLRRDPDNPDRIFEHSQSEFWVGYLALQRGDIEAARDHFTRYYDQAERLVTSDPSNTDWQMELMYARSNLGTLELGEGNAAKATTQFREVLSLSKELFGDQADDAQAVLELGRSYSWLVSSTSRLGNYSEAFDFNSSEVELYQQYIAGDGEDNALVRHQLAVAQNSRAHIHYAQGQIDQAYETSTVAVDLSMQNYAREPEGVQQAQQVILAHNMRAEVQRHRSELRAARSSIQKAISISGNLVELDDSVHQWRGRYHAQSQLTLAAISEAEGRLAESRATARAVVEDLQELVFEASADRSLILSYCEARAMLGRSNADPSAWETIYNLLTEQGADIEPQLSVLLAEAAVRTGKAGVASALVEKLLATDYRAPKFLLFLANYPQFDPAA